MKLVPKFSATPPIRNDGASSGRVREATSYIHANMLVVVVLPCVPATTSDSRPARNSSCSTAAIDVNGIRASSTNSSSTLPREMALPTITRSGLGVRFASA